jgi:hypothetical protein
MVRPFAFAAAALILVPGAPSAAQELQPVITPSQVGQGVLVSNIPRNQMGNPRMRARQSGASSSAHAAATCANKARARARLGADHPKVRELFRLCEIAGY